MDAKQLRSLLEQVRRGEVDLDGAMHRLKKLPFDDLGYAKVDHHRCMRQGVPEVVYCEGKTIPQIRGILQRIAQKHCNILASRASRAVYEAVREEVEDCTYHELARMIVINPREVEQIGNIVVVTAGTSDIPVADEAAITAETLGNRVNRIYDVGVAGIHRLLGCCDELFRANVAVVVAGMEGALASVVGGLVSCPVIGVPTSVGYGASFGGVAALLSMLNSCASGVSVVNIDNGFGAGYQASLINKLAAKRSTDESVHERVENSDEPPLAKASCRGVS
ncbi:MAG: nickel pincer cofactor biosynthesis protein LarB [Desulfomonilaceae bacterium]|nr:nickel pincer cofactor biosynthesis protein LarB [Desulfomonilaceae bacterium]